MIQSLFWSTLHKIKHFDFFDSLFLLGILLMRTYHDEDNLEPCLSVILNSQTLTYTHKNEFLGQTQKSSAPWLFYFIFIHVIKKVSIKWLSDITQSYVWINVIDIPFHILTSNNSYHQKAQDVADTAGLGGLVESFDLCCVFLFG